MTIAKIEKQLKENKAISLTYMPKQQRTKNKLKSLLKSYGFTPQSVWIFMNIYTSDKERINLIKIFVKNEKIIKQWQKISLEKNLKKKKRLMLAMLKKIS